MKTNVIMKIAIVFMAAFGAYAFSGNNANEQLTFKRSDTCQDIIAECSNQLEGETCMIFINNTSIPVLDLDCYTEIKHDSKVPVQWAPL